MTAKVSISSQVKDLLEVQNVLNAMVAEQLQTIAAFTAPVNPNYRRELSDYVDFDWSEIGAHAASSDRDGPTLVSFGQQIFKRRSGNGRFGNAIWYSRPIGHEDNKTIYARLITFKAYDPTEPLTFDPRKKSERTAGAKDDAAAEADAPVYGDGSAIPDSEVTHRIFNSYTEAHDGDIPFDGAALKDWFDDTQSNAKEAESNA